MLEPRRPVGAVMTVRTRTTVQRRESDSPPSASQGPTALENGAAGTPHALITRRPRREATHPQCRSRARSSEARVRENACMAAEADRSPPTQRPRSLARRAPFGHAMRVAPPRNRPYDIITFDCYGTLIDWETGIADAFRDAAAADDVRLDPAAAQRALREKEPESQAA